MTAAAMDGPTSKRKVTVARLTPAYNDVSPVPSRPSSRNNTRPTSRPPSPTKSFISTSSPLVTRPKAKVNSSAIRRTPSSTTQPDSPVNTNRPPSPVKFTSTRIRDGALSPPASTVGVTTRKPTVVRVKPSASVSSATSSKPKSSSPEPRNRSLTASSGTIRTQPDSRKRQGSATAVLHHTVSYSSLQPRSLSPSPSTLIRTGGPRVAQSEIGVPSDVVESNGDTGVCASQPIKIRSKVTAMAKNLNDAPPAPEPTPSIPTTKPATARVRAGSISSNVSYTNTTNNPTSPPHLNLAATAAAYPITTATPAANPHRYSTTRASPAASGLRSSFSSSSSPKHPPQQSDEFRPFAKTSIFPPSPNSISNGYSHSAFGGSARTVDDPANIPLPPQSPPVSSLSVSSRSSLSYTHEPGTSPESSVSFNLNLKKKREASPQRQSLRDTLDTLVAYASARDEDPILDERPGGLRAEEDEERKVRAEAKSNRKIADLEITNRSLLAINASLEKTKDRQAKEIRELKRKLRESRLILPPRAYRAVKSSLDPEEIGDDEEDIESSSDDDQTTDNAEAGGKGTGDETYGRIKLMLENLLESGRRALEKTKESYMEAKGGTKVLTAEEVETWRDSAGGLDVDRLSDSASHLGNGLDDIDGDEYSTCRPGSHSPTPQPAARNDIIAGLGLRNLNLPSPSSSSGLPSPKPPPILVTESS